VPRDLVNHKKMVIVRNRYQKWKEHDEICKIFNFEVTDVKVRHFTVILMFKKLPKLIGKKAAGWQALPGDPASLITFTLSNCPKIFHLNVSGLKIGNPTDFMTPFPFLPSTSSHDHLL